MKGINRNRDNFQENLRYELLTNKSDKNYKGDSPNDFLIKNNKCFYTIEDKTQPLESAYIFYTGEVDYNKDISKMCIQIFEDFCSWYAKNRNIVAKYFENK